MCAGGCVGGESPAPRARPQIASVELVPWSVRSRVGGSERRGRSRSRDYALGNRPSTGAGAGRSNRRTPVSFLLSQLKENAGPHLVPTRQSHLICRKWPEPTPPRCTLGAAT